MNPDLGVNVLHLIHLHAVLLSQSLGIMSLCGTLHTCFDPDTPFDSDHRGFGFCAELLSKFLVSPLITPLVVPYIIPYVTPPFKEFRLWLTQGSQGLMKSFAVLTPQSASTTLLLTWARRACKVTVRFF